MEEYTREQIQRADDTDLYVFLSGRGEQFKRCGKEYRWLRHDSVIIHGKGRKQREVPLWKTTVKYINKYLKTYPAECTDYLFINKNGDELTRSGVVYEHALINLYLK